MSNNTSHHITNYASQNVALVTVYAVHVTKGPSTWANVAPAANGRRQSPIDIQSKEALFDVKLGLRPLKMRYVPANSKTIINNGHTVQVSIDGANSSEFL